VLGSQSVEELGSAGRHPDEDAPAVGRVATPFHQAGALAPVDEAHRALMEDLQPIGQLRDGGGAARGAADEEKELVLGRRNPCPSGDLSGRPEKPPHGVPPVGKSPVVLVAERIEGASARHAPEYPTADISCYDVLRGIDR